MERNNSASLEIDGTNARAQIQIFPATVRNEFEVRESEARWRNGAHTFSGLYKNGFRYFSPGEVVCRNFKDHCSKEGAPRRAHTALGPHENN